MLQAESVGAGRAAASLDAALRRTVTAVAVGWQFAAIWVVVVTEPAEPRWRLIAAHLALVGLALLLLRGRRYLVLVGLAFYVVWTYDFYAAPMMDGALFLAACWLGNMAHLGVMLLLRRSAKVVIPVAATLASGTLLDGWSPFWSPYVTVTNAVTAIAIAVVAGVATRYLWTMVDEADGLARRVERERQAAAVATTAAREAADHARILHDTAINTLGAIANGGAALDDVEQVRERCAHDVAAVTDLIEGAEGSRRRTLTTVGSGLYGGVEVRRTGLDDRSVIRAEAELPDETTGALYAAVAELVRNVDKHAGVDTAVLDIGTTPDHLVVTVSDDGVGFDGTIPPGRGLAGSVVDRLAEVGAQVDLRTEPGRGTRVTITYPFAGPDRRIDDGAEWPSADELITRIQWWACWLWAIGLVAVGVAIEAFNRPAEFTMTNAMLAVVAATMVLTWAASRRTRSARLWVHAMLVLAVPVAFELGMAGAGFGSGDVFHYQAWGITPLLIGLLTLGRRLTPYVVGLGVLAVTALVTAVIVSGRSSEEGAVVVIGVMPAFVLALGWLAFHRIIAAILRRAEADRRLAFELSLEAAARQAEIGVRERWRAAELRDTVAVLRGIAAGSLDPRDPDVRGTCGREESYIRQLIQLSPDAFRIGPTLARALALAHARSLDLAVRTGSVDTPDGATARVLGAVIGDAVASIPADASLTVGVFEGTTGARFTLVAPAPLLAERIPRWDIPEEGWSVDHEAFGGQDLVQIGWSDAAVSTHDTSHQVSHDTSGGARW